MRTGPVVPTGVERTFGTDELIVSKTDPQGRITYANPVFLRVAAGTEEQLLGAPHNVIRHPAMPRCVFKLLWDTISDGQEIFAYVLNLALDGAHYWVLAHVTPTFGPDGRIVGYHSNRRCPDRSAISRIQPIYRALREREQTCARPAEALAAGAALLAGTLAEAGVDYERFVWSLAGARA